MLRLRHFTQIIFFLVLTILGHYLIFTQFPLLLACAFLRQLVLLPIILGLIFRLLNGTRIVSTSSGTVSYLGFDGSNGYTIKISNHNMTFSYSHVSPDFIVNMGDFVNQNQKIGEVGPKYITSIPNNPYHDSSRSPNKWRYNRLSFAF